MLHPKIILVTWEHFYLSNNQYKNRAALVMLVSPSPTKGFYMIHCIFNYDNYWGGERKSMFLIWDEEKKSLQKESRNHLQTILE